MGVFFLDASRGAITGSICNRLNPLDACNLHRRNHIKYKNACHPEESAPRMTGIFVYCSVFFCSYCLFSFPYKNSYKTNIKKVYQRSHKERHFCSTLTTAPRAVHNNADHIRGNPQILDFSQLCSVRIRDTASGGYSQIRRKVHGRCKAEDYSPAASCAIRTSMDGLSPTRACHHVVRTVPRIPAGNVHKSGYPDMMFIQEKNKQQASTGLSAYTASRSP